MNGNDRQTGHIDSVPASSENDKTNDMSADKCHGCGVEESETMRGKGVDVWIGCSSCEMWWHVSCAGMQGLTTKTVKELTQWNCHFCFEVPARLKETQVSMEVGQIVAREIQMGLASVTEAVSSCVQKSLQDSLVGTLVGAANAEITRSWAKIASGDQTKLITEVVQVASGPALSTITQQIDANMQQRLKRVKHIVVSNLPDSGKETESQAELKDIICQHATDLTTSDIQSAKRVGDFSRINRNKFRGRMVIAVLNSEERASYMHNNGRGFVYRGSKQEDDVWINPDMIKADRDVQWNTREKRKAEADLKKKGKPVAAPKPSGNKVKPVIKNEPKTDVAPVTNVEHVDNKEDVVQNAVKSKNE